jgi:uncharacterized protein YdgA (DUF945 family)
VKKGVVALFVVLAVIILVSPGIVGRLAERSMDDNLDWAAAENDDIVVSSQGFDRGWFSSAGTHRIELRDGPLKALVLDLANAEGASGLPVLIVETKLDHGLVAVTSMSREHGSLAPGLGSAVSTLAVEFADGSVADLPGTIYSNVALNGMLTSNLVLPAGSASEDGNTLDWGDVDIVLTASPQDGTIAVEGSVASIRAAYSGGETTRVDRLAFSGRQRPGPFGFPVGEMRARVDSLVATTGADTTTLGATAFDARLDAEGRGVSAGSTLRIDGIDSDFRAAGLVFDGRVRNLDGVALGALWRHVRERAGAGDVFDEQQRALQMQVLAAGFALDIDQLDLELPQGPFRSSLHAVLGKTDAANVSLAALLLALEARFELSMAEELADLATTMNTQAGAAIALGYLKKEGDAYTMLAELSKGRLTINGAPMQLPLGALQP